MRLIDAYRLKERKEMLCKKCQTVVGFTDKICEDCSIKMAMEWIDNTPIEVDIESVYIALEKQKPKKPIDYFTEKHCPTCKSIWGVHKGQLFCDKCGQAIDWSEV